MIGAAGVGKTAYFLYPNLEYACASGMSFLTTDTKGDLFRNYAGVAAKYYGYDISVLDLRNPMRSGGFNMLHLVYRYMDIYLDDTDNISARAKAERYAKITAKTIIFSDGHDSSSYGQNSFFYDAAKGLLTATILLIAEFCSPKHRHIVSVFKILQELLEPVEKGKPNRFQVLMKLLPPEHKAKWFAGAALSKSLGKQTVMSGHVTTGKNDPSQSLQMIGRDLMTPDELKALPKGRFIVTKTGTQPMQTKLELFFKWGITFDAPYELAEKSARVVEYASAIKLKAAILAKYPHPVQPKQAPAPQNKPNQPDEKLAVRVV